MFVRCALLLALVGYSAASKWAVDGGDFYRTSRITIANDIAKVESVRFLFDSVCCGVFS